ncbi:7-carboxy-7-deazaguanine synthase QueE [Flavobacteriaceae bacterium]|nr:7-carboxy-7-deazaguanine synthase QueE [Flavobacteriaceae bacterium]
MKNRLAISEVFYSIQGEGKTVGIPAVFVRLGGCNLICGGMGTQFDGELHNGAEWRCDSIEVWMKAQSKYFEDILPADCITAIKNGAHVVLTGGEPMMQQEQLENFIIYIQDHVYKDTYFEVETNGTILPSNFLLANINLWNCSPKLTNAGMAKNMTFVPKVIKTLNDEHTIFKFVVNSEKDWGEIQEDYLPIINKRKIYLMPSGESQELLNENKLNVVELAKDNYLNFTTRLHIEIWNKKTGV